MTYSDCSDYGREQTEDMWDDMERDELEERIEDLEDELGRP